MSNMRKRHHALYVGEKVFCCDDAMCWVTIKELNRKNAIVKAQTGDTWKTSRANLYQIAKNVYCSRTNSVVCYEHMRFKENNYPYYCPALNENLFGFETEKK